MADNDTILNSVGASVTVASKDVAGVKYPRHIIRNSAGSADIDPLSESDFDAKIGSLTETAPATDIASSGLNGRLQRVAQRLTSLIALLPTALGAGGGVKVDGSGTALPVSGSVTVGSALPAGTNNIGDVDVLTLPTLPAGTNNIGDVDVLTLPSLPTGANTIGAVTQSGTWTVQPGNTANTTAWKVDGSAVTQPVSGSVTANAGTNLNTSALATSAKQPALGTAGSASTDVITVQGIASGTTLPVTGTITAVTAITNALPAGANAIGKLAANSGVDIGDVDVTSVTPGTAAASLGKAEDAAHASGDVGVMFLGVRQDTAAALAGTDGDYQPPTFDSQGNMRVNPAQITSATATLANVSGSASSVTLLASNTARICAHIANDSSAVLYIKRGSAASTTSYSHKLFQDDEYDVNDGYTGILTGIWASATGAARTTEDS